MSSYKNYEEALESLKGEEFDISSLLIFDGDSVDILNMLSVWRYVSRCQQDVNVFENDECVHESWRYIDFDVRDWSLLSGVREEFIWREWVKLARMKLIYPDGTCPDEVYNMLKQKAEDMLYFEEKKDVSDEDGG